MYWPGIMENVKEYIKRCDIFHLTRPSQQKEPLIPYDVLSGPWKKVGINIFQHRSSDYLLVADYLSNFPLVRPSTGLFFLKKKHEKTTPLIKKKSNFEEKKHIL